MNSDKTLQQWTQEWKEKTGKLGAISHKTLLETDWENLTKEEFMRIMDEQSKG